MAIKDWTTVYPGDLDTNTNQPTLVNDQDETRVSQIHAIRDAVQELQALVGSDNLEPGSLRASGGGGSASFKDYQQALFVGKHGNDSYDGKDPNSPFLTFDAALTAAGALSPTPTSRVVVIGLDAGTYLESAGIEVDAYVDIYAPTARLTTDASPTASTALTVNHSSHVRFGLIEPGNNVNGVVKANVSGDPPTVTVDQLTLTGSGVGVFNTAFSSGGAMMFRAQKLYVDTGIGIGDASGGVGHTHIFVGDLYFTGDNSVGLSLFSGGSIVGTLEHIVDIGGGSNTTGISITDGDIEINSNLIVADVAYNVSASGRLSMFVNRLVGTETVTSGGIANVTKAGVFSTKTSGELHVYANGTSGDDSNDGLSSGSPKKTLQAVFDLVPNIVNHNTTVHLAGTFTDFDEVYLHRTVTRDAVLVVDGGDTTTSVLGSTAATGATANTITAGASWTTNQYQGYVLEMTSGAASGDIRMIQGNTSNTITVTKDFSTTPSIGNTFVIYRPTTTLDGDTVPSRIITSGKGLTYFQRLYCVNDVSLKAFLDDYPTFTHIVHNGLSTLGQEVEIFNCAKGHLTGDRLNPDTYAAVTDEHVGVSILNTSGQCYVFESQDVQVLGSMLNEFFMVKGFFSGLSEGSLCKHVLLRGVVGCGAGLDGFRGAAGHADTVVSRTSGAALELEGCIGICFSAGAGDVEVASGDASGIVVKQSHVTISGGSGLKGTSSSNGMFVGVSSSVQINSGTPTIGGSNDVTFGGGGGSSTWATITGGTPFVDSNLLSVVRNAV